MSRFVWLVMLFALISTAARAETVRVATDEWEGVSNKDGSGYYLDLLRAIYPDPQFEVKIEFVPYARAFMMVKEGTADIVPGIYENDLPEQQRSTYPIEVDSVDVLVKKELAQQWKGLESFSNMRVMGRTEYGFGAALPEDVKYSEYHSLASMLKMLAAGKIDAVLDYETEMEPLRKEAGLTDDFVYVRGVITENTYIGFSESRPELRQRFDQEYKTLYQSGKIKEFMIRNMGSDDFLPELEF